MLLSTSRTDTCNLGHRLIGRFGVGWAEIVSSCISSVPRKASNSFQLSFELFHIKRMICRHISLLSDYWPSAHVLLLFSRYPSSVQEPSRMQYECLDILEGFIIHTWISQSPALYPPTTMGRVAETACAVRGGATRLVLVV